MMSSRPNASTDALDGTPIGLALGHITHARYGAAATVPDAGGHFLQDVSVPADEHHPRALISKTLCGRTADLATCSSDHGAKAGEPSGHRGRCLPRRGDSHVPHYTSAART